MDPGRGSAVAPRRHPLLDLARRCRRRRSSCVRGLPVFRGACASSSERRRRRHRPSAHDVVRLGVLPILFEGSGSTAARLLRARRARRLLRLGLDVMGATPGAVRRERGVRCALEDCAPDAVTFLPRASPRRPRRPRIRLELPNGGRRVVQAHLDELQLDATRPPRPGRSDEACRACPGQHLEVIEVDMPFRRGHEEEAAARNVPRAPRALLPARREARARVDARQPGRLDARALRDRAELPLDLERCVASDMTTWRPRRPGNGSDDLARALVTFCASSRRARAGRSRRRMSSSDRVELRAQRLLDGLAVLRIRHVDEVDDDDSADVAQPELRTTSFTASRLS